MWDDLQPQWNRRVSETGLVKPVEFQDPVSVVGHAQGERRDGTVGHRQQDASLALFLVLVVVLEGFPAGPMTIEFATGLDGSGADIDPALLCVKGTHANGTDIHCHLSGSEGIDRVVVRSGGRTLVVDRNPPFDFTVQRPVSGELPAGNGSQWVSSQRTDR